MPQENFGYNPATGRHIEDKGVELEAITSSPSSYLSLTVDGMDINLHIDDSTSTLDEKLIKVFEKLAELMMVKRGAS